MKHTLRTFLLLMLILISQQMFANSNATRLYRSDVLSSTLFTKVTQDDLGFIWVATEYGLNRFDGYSFHTYYHQENQPTSLADDHIHNLVHTPDGSLWICSSRLQRYAPLRDCFETIDADEGAVAIADVACLHDSIIYAVSNEGALYRFDRKARKLHKWKEASQRTEGRRTLFLCIDRDGRTFWLGGQQGLLRLDSRTLQTKRYGRAELKHEQVSNALLDADGTLYIQTPANVCKYNRKEERFEALTFGHGNGFKSIRCLAGDCNRSLLVGTFGVGAYRVQAKSGAVEHLSLMYDRNDLSDIDVSTIFCDRDGNLWMGCFQKGLALVPRLQTSFAEVDIRALTFNNHHSISLLADAGAGELWIGQGNNGLYRTTTDGRLLQRYLPYTTPIAMHKDAQGDLWVGLYDEGVGRLNPKSGAFDKLPQFPNKRVRAIDEDRQGNLYFAIFDEGVFCYQPRTGQVERLPKEVNTHQVMTLMVDSKERLWIGSYEGVKCYDLRKKRRVELHSDGGPVGTLINNFAEDVHGHLWMATSDGLYHYDCRAQKYTHIAKEDGLPDDMVCEVQVAPNGEVWLSTYKGLVCYNEQMKQFAMYHKGDGLTGAAFVRSVGMTSAEGRMFFAYDDGYLYFHPLKIEEVPALSPVHLSGIRLPFAKLKNASDSLRLSAYGVEEHSKLRLKYDENVVVLSFLSLDHLSSDNLSLQYRISNRPEAPWLSDIEGNNTLQLGPLAPGHYDLEVRTTVNGVSAPTRKYQIIVDHPWYSSWWMRCIYALIAIGFIYQFFVGYNNYLVRKRNEERIKFFIDLTHELRSPTTLMLAPLQELMRRTWDEETGRRLRAIYRNGNRLLQLLNQILDVRKIDKGKMYIRCSETNIVEYVHDIFRIFDYEAEKRKIRFTFHAEEEELKVYIDRAHFDKVIYNLLSNAFKFVADGGEIRIDLRRVTTGRTEQVEIRVADDGKGIDKNEVDKVFERFYQAPSNKTAGRVGFGIGLNLCYNIVHLHHGTITVGNREDGVTGAVFTITLPTGHAHLSDEELLQGESAITSADPVKLLQVRQFEAMEKEKEAGKGATHRREHTVLVADDDPDLLEYLRQSLSGRYRVITCLDGAEALSKTIERVPDLVISDISMPKVDGFTLLTRLKSNSVTSHIPIILLTSLSEHENRIAGLQKGADAYIAKPFDLEELLAQAQGLINTRTKLRGKFAGEQEQQGKVTEVALRGANEKLMESVMKVINEHFSNPDLTVEFLADKVGLSRTQLHRRMKEITGISCGDFIRNFRMQQAARLLKEGDVYVSQICYAVGFSNPTHFSTAFKRYYGVTPSDYVAGKKPEKQGDAAE